MVNREHIRSFRYTMQRLSLFILLLVSGIGFFGNKSIASVHAQTSPSVWGTLGKQLEIDSDAKFPDTILTGGRLYVSWSTEGAAKFGERGILGGPIRTTTIGEVKGDPTYFTTSIAAGTDGSIHYVWIRDEKTVLHKSRDTSGNWSAQRTVASNQNFANGVNIAVQGNTIFAIWKGEGSGMYATSTNNGETWTPKPLGNKIYGGGIGTPSIAVSGTNVYVAWLGADLYNYFGKWNGSSFDIQRTFADKNLREPQIAIMPDGRIAMANRDDSNAYYAEQRADGTWDVQQISTAGGVTPQTAIAVDKGGNVHMAWVEYQSGTRQVMYALRRKGADAFLEPVVVTSDAHHYKVNLSLAVDSSGYSVQLLWETFYFENPDDEWPKHKIMANNVRTFLSPPPPPPPCNRFDAIGRCMEVDTAIGLLATLPSGFVGSLMVFILSFSGGVAVLLIMYAGYIFITSRDQKDQVQKARQIIVAVIVGILVTVFSMVIFEVIGIDILGLPNFSR